MKLNKFTKRNKQHQIVWVLSTCAILLITFILIYKTYAIYEEKEEYNMIKGIVPDQDYDTMITFIEVEKNGTKKVVNNIPEGKDWTIEVNCNNNATAKWDYESWELKLNFSKTRTKCKLTFYPYRTPLSDYGINERVISTGEGLYEVTHDNIKIISNLSEQQKANLKKTEYRYAGYNPNNYIQFNDELWRIIGLVNTPEGPRMKLFRFDKIGAYSWDTSASNINGGFGINEWSTSAIMNLLNNGPYYNRTSGICYNGENNANSACDFSESGLTNLSKQRIDEVTWNTAAVLRDEVANKNIPNFYEVERGNKTGKLCTNGTYCTDTVTRTTTWIGSVGLIYPSDYGYATSGGKTQTRDKCINEKFSLWSETNMQDCKLNNWLDTHWTITPAGYEERNVYAYYMASDGTPSTTSAKYNLYINPVIYLKPNIKIVAGNGTEDNPYTLSNE